MLGNFGGEHWFRLPRRGMNQLAADVKYWSVKIVREPYYFTAALIQFTGRGREPEDFCEHCRAQDEHFLGPAGCVRNAELASGACAACVWNGQECSFVDG